MPRRHPVAALAAAAWLLLLAARALTAAPDAWEWDEVLFTNAVRDGIDLNAMRPHAPGYPLFITCGRALAAVGVEPFRATTLAGLAGGLLAPAALVALLVALEVPLAWATIGGALYAFIPAVWLHSVRPLSDPLAAATFLGSAAALLAAVRRSDGRFLLAGAGLAGLCFGVRPQTAVALLPFAVWAAFRLVRQRRAGFALASAGAGLAVSTLATLPAVLGSGGWASYRALVVHQAAYVQAEDSLHLADYAKADTWMRWVRDPFGPDALAAAFLLLALAGALAAPRKALILAAVFVPLAALTIPFSSLPAAPRYAVVLLPFPAALCALALRRLAARAPRRRVRGRRPRGSFRRRGRTGGRRGRDPDEPSRRGLPGAARRPAIRRPASGRVGRPRAAPQVDPPRPRGPRDPGERDRERDCAGPRRHVGRRRLRPGPRPAVCLHEPAPHADLAGPLPERLDRRRGAPRRRPAALAGSKRRVRLVDGRLGASPRSLLHRLRPRRPRGRDRERGGNTAHGDHPAGDVERRGAAHRARERRVPGARVSCLARLEEHPLPPRGGGRARVADRLADPSGRNPVTRIDSPSNPRIAAAARAVEKGELMLLEGRRMVEEALDARIALDEVFVQSENSEEHEDFLGRVRGAAPSASLTMVSIRAFKRLSDLQSSRGIAALATPPHRALTSLTPSKKSSSSSLFLLLDDVQDPANVGAIVRCAEAFGVAAAVFTPGCAWPFSPRALRASAGSALRVPIAARVPAGEAVAWARAAGATLAGADAHGGEAPETAARIRPLVLVVGSEGHGISPEVNAALDRRLTLELRGRVESLNAAVAAGLLLYVLTRS